MLEEKNTKYGFFNNFKNYIRQKIRTYLFNNFKLNIDENIEIFNNYTRNLPDDKYIVNNEKEMETSYRNENIFDSNAYLTYYAAYTNLLKKQENKQKNINQNNTINLFNLSQSAFFLHLTKFKHSIIFCELNNSFLEEIIEERFREFSVDFRNFSKLNFQVKIEMLSFIDNSVILNIHFNKEELKLYFDLINDNKDKFFNFINENNRVSKKFIDLHADNKLSQEQQIYYEQQNESLNIINTSYIKNYELLIDNFKNAVFIKIDDIENVLKNIVKIKSVSVFGQKPNHNINNKFELINFLKKNQLLIKLIKKENK